MKPIVRLARRSRVIAGVRQLFMFAASTTYQWKQPQFRLRLPGFFPQNPEADFEKVELEFLKTLSDHFECVIDVGANIGVYTGMFAALGKTVIALEPIWSNRLYLNKLVSMNAFADRVTILPFALGEGEGEAAIYGDQAGASMIPGFHDCPAGRSHQVKVTTLDRVLREHQFLSTRSLLVKVDVEGFEYSVLQGARKALTMEPKAIWFVEVAPENWEKVLYLFAGAGFKHAVMFSEGRSAHRPIEALPTAFPSANIGLGYCNLIFLKDGTVVS